MLNNIVPNGEILATLETADGMYIGGSFTTLQQKSDGTDFGIEINSTNSNFIRNLKFNSYVSCAIISGDYLYLGGNFTTCLDVACQRIVKINLITKAVDTTFDSASGFNAVVRSIALDSNGNLYAAGDFTSYKGTTRQYIAKLNASTGALDTTFDSASGFGAAVYSIALDGSGDVYAGGNFTSYKGTTRQRIAKLNGSTAALDATFDSASGFNNNVRALALDDSGNLYVGGTFDGYKVSIRQRIAKLNASTAALDATFHTGSGFNTEVRAIALDGAGNVYVGGLFTGYKNDYPQRIAKLNGSNAALDTTFSSTTTGFNNNVESIALDGSGNLYVGGDFTHYKGTARERIAKLNASTAALDTTFDSAGGFNGAVLAIVPGSDGNVYAMGYFNVYKGITRQTFSRPRIAKILKNGTIDTTFNPGVGFNSVVRALALGSDGNLYVGGEFDAYKNTTRQSIAKLNGSTAALDTTFDSASGFVFAGAAGTIYSLALDGSGDVYAGGSFTSYKGTTRQRIAKLNGSTAALDATFDSQNGFGSAVFTIALNGSNLYAGGQFNSYKGTSCVYIAKLDASTAAIDTTFDSASGFNLSVRSIITDGSGNLYVGGDFTSYKGLSHGRIVKLNGSTAAVDATFNTGGGFGNIVRALALDDSGNLYVGGDFTEYKTTVRQRIAKLNASTAALDTTFDSSLGFNEMGDSVNSIVVNSSAQTVYVGGRIKTYKNTYRNNSSSLEGWFSNGAALSMISANTVAPPTNSAPVNIVLSSNAISENSAANATIGTLSATDAEGGAMTFSLVAGAGATDNASFMIQGNALKLANGVSVNYETKSSYSIRVSATDSGNLTYEKAFTINVTNVNEAPSGITLSANSITEGNAVGAVIGTLSAIDPDTGDTPTLSVQAGADKFEIVGNQLKAKVTFDYETATSHSVTIRATDGLGEYLDQTFTINVANSTSDDPVALSANQIMAGGKFKIHAPVDPRLGLVQQSNGDALTVGSVVQNTLNGANNQKFLKIAGDGVAYKAIHVTPPAEWKWAESGNVFWAMLQDM